MGREHAEASSQSRLHKQEAKDQEDVRLEHPASSLSESRLRYLQRTIGNQAVQRLIAQKKLGNPGGEATVPTARVQRQPTAPDLEALDEEEALALESQSPLSAPSTPADEDDTNQSTDPFAVDSQTAPPVTLDSDAVAPDNQPPAPETPAATQQPQPQSPAPGMPPVSSQMPTATGTPNGNGVGAPTSTQPPNPEQAETAPAAAPPAEAAPVNPAGEQTVAAQPLPPLQMPTVNAFVTADAGTDVGTGAPVVQSEETRARLSERASRIMAVAAELEVRIRTRGAAALAQLTASFETARTQASTDTAQARAMIQARYAAGRARVTAMFEAAHAAMQSTVSGKEQQVNAADSAEQGRLQSLSSETVTQIEDAPTQFDEGAERVGETESERATSSADTFAENATSMAQSRANSGSGDADVQAAKAREFPQAGSEAAGHFRDGGDEAESGIQDLVTEGETQFGEQTESVVSEVESVADTALQKIPEITGTMLERLSTLLTGSEGDLDSAFAQIMSALDESEAKAQAEIDQAEATMMSQLDAGYTQASEGIQSQVDQVAQQVLQGGNDAAAELNNYQGNNVEAAFAAAGQSEQLLYGQVEGFEATLDSSIPEIEASLASGNEAYAAGFTSSLSAVDGQIEQLIGSLQGGLSTTENAFEAQTEEEVGGFQETLTGAVDATGGAFSEVVGAMGDAANQALEQLSSIIGGAATESVAKMQTESSALEGEFSQANAEIEANAQKGFWEKVWDEIKEIVSSVMFWIGVGLAAIVIAIAAIVSAKAALIVGAVLLVVMFVVTTVQRGISLWEEDAPWYKWVVFIVFRPTLGLFDALGLSGLIEGTFGYDLVTWRKLSEDEQAKRMAGGIVAAVMLIVTWGASKVVPVRGAPGGRPLPPRVEPPKIEPPKIEPPKVEPPRVEPPAEKPPVDTPDRPPTDTPDRPPQDTPDRPPVPEVANGTLTQSEAAQLQAIANRYNTEIHVVGSRANGTGRNINNPDLPVGKGPGTRSDIDVRIDGQADINSGGRLSNDISNVSNGAGNIVSSGLPEVPSQPPFIPFRPSRGGGVPPAETPPVEPPKVEPPKVEPPKVEPPGEKPPDTPEPTEPVRPGVGDTPDSATLSDAGRALDKGAVKKKDGTIIGFTRAGRAIQKHGSRSPEVWGDPAGKSPTELNASGQAVVDQIANSPDTVWTARHHTRFGDVLEGKLPDGRGARWSGDGKKFHGFLEP